MRKIDVDGCDDDEGEISSEKTMESLGRLLGGEESSSSWSDIAEETSADESVVLIGIGRGSMREEER